MTKDSPNQNDKSGTPASLLVSIVSTIVVFAMAEIQNSFDIGDSFAMRYVLMSYVGLGLALAFFWKRLERSPFLKISSGLYLFGLWVSLFMTTLAPVLLKGESPFVHGQVMQQFGLAFVVMSGFMLIVALLQNQKMVPGLLFSALGAVLLMVTGSAGFFLKGHHDDHGAISAHSVKGHDSPSEKHGDKDKDEDGEEISSRTDEHGKSMAAKAHAADGAEDEAAEHPEADHEEALEGDHESKSLDQVIDEMEHGTENHPKADKGHAVKSGHKEEAKDKEKEEAEHGHAQKSPKPVAVKEVKGKKSPVASLEHATESKKAPNAEKNAAWSYEAGPSSPEHWGDLADEYRKCSVGQAQSPIDIPSAWPTMNDVSLDYKLTPVSIVDNGRTIQFNVGKQNFARIAGKKYELVQFHIHTPSEHWIDGRSSPMEIHFVHKGEKGALAVVSVMVDQGAEQKVFGEMWGYVPQALNLPASPRGKVFNIATLVPAKTKVYRYRGSDTTPPCAENVLWSVASEKMTFSKEQIDAFRVRYKNNARPIQKRGINAH